MKTLMIALLLCLPLAECYSQPPAGTFKSKVYGNKTVYSDRGGRILGTSKNYGRQTTYYNGQGRVISREYRYRGGATFIPQKASTER